MENTITHLERLGFFVAPASTKFHLNVKGGLMQHSWNVCNTALMLREQMIQMNPEQKSNLQMARDTAPLCAIIQAADGLSTALLEK